MKTHQTPNAERQTLNALCFLPGICGSSFFLVLSPASAGNFKEAINYMEQEKEIRYLKQGRENSKYESCLTNLGYLYGQMGQYDKDLPLYIEAIQNNYHYINQAFGFLAEAEKLEGELTRISSSFNQTQSLLNY